jgi:AcrR family transcriptional regulator
MPAAGTMPKRRPGRPRLEEPSDEYKAKRAEIIDTASRLFHTKGYESKLDDLAEALDFRKASLYYYVRSKAELLYLIFDRAITLGLEQLDELSRIADPRERLEALVRHQADTIAANPSLFAVYFDQRVHLAENYHAEIREKERRYLRAYADAVAAAVKAGVIPAVDPFYAGEALLGMTSWLYKWYSPEQHDPRAFADACVRLLGLGAERSDGTKKRKIVKRPTQR